jgi:hypothetical protein
VIDESSLVTRTELTLAVWVAEESLGHFLGGRAHSLQITSATLAYHPFAGFEFTMPGPFAIVATARVLVDRFTGKPFLSGAWEEAAPAPLSARVRDPQWNTIDRAEALRRARSLVQTARLKRAKLSVLQDTCLVRTVSTVWKPNWLVHVSSRGREFKILVDGLSGRYFVIGG